MIDLRLGNALELARALPDCTVQTIVTSPPYWGLRAYGTNPQIWKNGHELCAEHEWSVAGYGDRRAHGAGEGKWLEHHLAKDITPHVKVKQGDICARCGAWRGELGLEPTPEMFVQHLVELFRELRRALKDDGTLWLNLGDSFASNSKGSGGPSAKQDSNAGSRYSVKKLNHGLKEKDLVGIPWRVAFALQADGWYLRSDIIWHKPNPMPESVRDRPTKSHEYIFLLSKSAKYYYDSEAIREKAKNDSGFAKQLAKGKPHIHHKPGNVFLDKRAEVHTGFAKASITEFRNRRSVWTVTTRPFNGVKLMTDYVGDDGKPYRASEDCPLHGHLARSRKSYTLFGDGQPTRVTTRTSGNGNGHGQESFSESKPTISHTHAEASSGNSLSQIQSDTPLCKTSVDQNGHISPVQTPDHNGRKSTSHVLSDHKTDSTRPEYSAPANGHNKRKSKTARARRTLPHDSVSAQTLFDIPSIESSDANTDSVGHKHESNTVGDSVSNEQAIGLSAETSARNVHIEIVSYPDYKCTCRIVSIDHFATFPEALIEPCVLAGARVGDVVLDPFNGAGTTGVVAKKNGRSYIGFELNPDYLEMARERIEKTQQQIALLT